MRVIVRPRQHGKTLELIKLCQINPGYVIIVPQQRYKENIKGLAKKYGFKVPDTYTVDEFKLKRPNITKFITGILVDNADYILKNYLGLYHDYKLEAICIDGLPKEQDYDEQKDYDEYQKLTYNQFRELKDKAWMYDDLNK